MFVMKAGSMGEIPPRRRGKPGTSLFTALAAALVMAAKIFHSGSISKSQCDLLFGSFQSITASITRWPRSKGSPLPEDGLELWRFSSEEADELRALLVRTSTPQPLDAEGCGNPRCATWLRGMRC